MSKTTRDSNVELLRIIIMFLILLLHANFLVFGKPLDYSFKSFTRSFAEAFTLTPVNIFILITGYFGTSFSLKKVMSLVYQVIFCVVPISLILYALGFISLEYHYFACHKYWFINAYIGLLVIVPLLNISIEKFTQKQFKSLLITFYIIALIGALIGLQGIEIAGGYSLLWFIFLYLLGRYVKFYPPQLSKKQLFLFILFSCLLEALIIFSLRAYYDYVEPFIVIQSVCTLLLFTKFKIRKKWINYIGSSTTMVYLVNLHPALWQFENNLLLTLNQQFRIPIFLLYTFLLCMAVFIFAIFYDKIRRYTWNIVNLMFNKTSNY